MLCSYAMLCEANIVSTSPTKHLNIKPTAETSFLTSIHRSKSIATHQHNFSTCHFTAVSHSSPLCTSSVAANTSSWCQRELASVFQAGFMSRVQVSPTYSVPSSNSSPSLSAMFISIISAISAPFGLIHTDLKQHPTTSKQHQSAATSCSSCHLSLLQSWRVCALCSSSCCYVCSCATWDRWVWPDLRCTYICRMERCAHMHAASLTASAGVWWVVGEWLERQQVVGRWCSTSISMCMHFSLLSLCGATVACVSSLAIPVDFYLLHFCSDFNASYIFLFVLYASIQYLCFWEFLTVSARAIYRISSFCSFQVRFLFSNLIQVFLYCVSVRICIFRGCYVVLVLVRHRRCLLAIFVNFDFTHFSFLSFSLFQVDFSGMKSFSKEGKL